MEYEVNKRIRQYRSAADMSQADMADKLGIKRSTYARRESKGKFDSETIMKISEILKISPMILLYGENEFNVGVTVHDGKKTPFEPTDDFVITTKERKLLSSIRTLAPGEIEKVIQYINDLKKR